MKYSCPVHLLGARRTPLGRFGGALRGLTPVDLALPVAHALVPERLKTQVGQVVLGQMLPAGGGMAVVFAPAEWARRAVAAPAPFAPGPPRAPALPGIVRPSQDRCAPGGP